MEHIWGQFIQYMIHASIIHKRGIHLAIQQYIGISGSGHYTVLNDILWRYFYMVGCDQNKVCLGKS